MFESGGRQGAAADGVDPAALATLPVDQKLAILRQRIAAVPGKIGATTSAPAPAADVLAVPGALGELLPDGGLTRGTIVGCSRGAVLCALLAAASASGTPTAVVCTPGTPQLGLLASWEMGARLDRIAVIQVSAEQALTVVEVLADGVALIVLDVPAARVRPAQVEGLRARVRAKRAVLVVTGGDWARRPHLGIAVRGIGCGGISHGRGRIRTLDYDVEVTAAGRPPRRGRVTLTGDLDGHTRWVQVSPVADAPRRLGLAHTG
ncbi:hypothetical protein ACFXHA_43275 [Nocardia sp. NPDC059240]|uniref:hypothetical protein n=1 Tax=Nocardia sp. NPDC059240 TaxID=3346786 RepID=UPI003678A812